uniref:Uncharacterized protein n=1 Tax=Octopus bimaculoides TaxID=37653 RepID=A0A0L8FJ70_OCTBM
MVPVARIPNSIGRLNWTILLFGYLNITDTKLFLIFAFFFLPFFKLNTKCHVDYSVLFIYLLL